MSACTRWPTMITDNSTSCRNVCATHCTVALIECCCSTLGSDVNAISANT